MHNLKVCELKEIKTKRDDETTITYKAAAVNDTTRARLILFTEEPSGFSIGQEITVQGDKSQKKIGG